MPTKLLSFVSALLMYSAAFGQQASPGKAMAVELSVPFGTAPGKLLLLGNYLVFVDDQQPEASVVLTRQAIEQITAEGADLTLLLREPARNRTGEVKRLSLRAAPGEDMAAIRAWHASAPAAAAASGGDTADSTYPVRHNHRIGACNGRLFVTATQLSFESVNDVSHSRRWEFSSIKELENKNPYEIEIKPFTGSGYKLQLEGSGIEPAAFKALVDRVTAARLPR